MALNIPTSTQWITFPTRPGDAFFIEWSEGKIAKKATYYSTVCYYGSLTAGDATKQKAALEETKKNKGDMTADGLVKPIAFNSTDTLGTILGKTQLYIATEYLEAQYRGGPMRGFHLLDVAQVPTNQTESVWMKCQLNECFRYGQDASKDTKIRFIVYHPPISKSMKAPRMFQHRFTGLTSADFAKAAAAELPEYAPEQFQAAAKAAGMMADYGIGALKDSVGHYLHKYLDAAGVQEAGKRETQADKAELDKARKNVADKTTDALALDALAGVGDADGEWKRLLALQYTEVLRCAKENEETDANLEKRLTEQANFRRKAMAEQGKAQTFFKSIGNLFTRTKGKSSDKYTDEDKQKAAKEYKVAFEELKVATKQEQIQVDLDFEEGVVDVAAELKLTTFAEDQKVIKALGVKRGSVLIDHDELRLPDDVLPTATKPSKAVKTGGEAVQNNTTTPITKSAATEPASTDTKPKTTEDEKTKAIAEGKKAPRPKNELPTKVELPTSNSAMVNRNAPQRDYIITTKKNDQRTHGI